MTVPTTVEYSIAIKSASSNAVITTLDESVGAALLKIKDAADATITTLTLGNPSGTVDGLTGLLTLDIPDQNANGSGEAAYIELCNGDGVAHISAPAVVGDAPVSGKFVINTLTIVSGEPVEVISATVG